MSEATTPSSGSRSPASSHSSRHTSYSDTTPSPSCDRRSPLFNPHRLSHKLALLEASESLAQVAETLSVAAKAMSKAAASLAVASGYQDYEYDRSDSHTSRLRDREHSGDLVGSPKWQQTSYAFPSPNAQDMERNGIYEADDLQNDRHEHSTATLQGTVGEVTLDAGVNRDQTGSPEVSSKAQPAPASTASPKQQSETLVSRESSQTAGMIPSLPSESETMQPQQEKAPWASSDRLDGSATVSSSMATSIPQPESKVTLPTSELSQEPSSPPLEPYRRRILLDSGFDQLPLICALSTRHAKMVCLYKYWAASSVIGTAFRHNISQEVIIPVSTNLSVLQAAANDFMRRSSAILLWPAHIALPTSHSFLSLSEAHVFHLGYPSKENADFEASKVSVVLAQSEFDNLGLDARDSIVKRYHPDEMTEDYNRQGPGSALHKARVWMRSRLAKNPSARGFYMAWMGFHRKHNPSWPAEELVRRANEFAEEYLLRGEPRTSKHTGGRIPATKTEVKSMKLEPAVEAGILLVS